MTMDELVIGVEDEICMCTDIPQERWIVEYAIREFNVTFGSVGKWLPDDFDEYGYDENYNWIGEGDEPEKSTDDKASQ